MKKTAYIIPFLLFISISSIYCQSTILNLYETDEYKINFPGQPEKNTQTVQSYLGELLMTIVSFELNEVANDSNFVYMVIESKYPDSTIHSNKKEMLDAFFRNAITGSLKSVDGKLLKEISEIIGIYPSRTIEVDYQNGLAVLKMKMILRESKLIIIQTITSTANYPNYSIDKFFNSFNLK